MRQLSSLDILRDVLGICAFGLVFYLLCPWIIVYNCQPIPLDELTDGFIAFSIYSVVMMVALVLMYQENQSVQENKDYYYKN